MPRHLLCLNETRQTTLGDSIRVADNFFSRFMGLMGCGHLPSGHGLWIRPCNSIHMLWMRIALDVVFIDKNHTVIGTLENIRPWRVSKTYRGAHSCIELPVGTIANSNTQPGDQLRLTE
jgi:uncharacterized protein